jgi:hypothetical protein
VGGGVGVDPDDKRVLHCDDGHAFDLAAGLRVIRPGIDVGDAEFAEQDLQGGASAAVGVAVKMAPLSVSTEAGVPQRAKAVVTVSVTSGPVMVGRATLAMASREWSSMMSRISTPVSSARCQW